MRWCWIGLSLIASACAGTEPNEWSFATPDRAQFELEVYPVLLRDCAFHDCHGSSKRFFQVFGTGRGRLASESRALDPVSPAELAHSYERARSMIDTGAPARSLLLEKPLAVSAGGTGHEGVDEFGRNVYQTPSEPGYVALTRWVVGLSTGTARP